MRGNALSGWRTQSHCLKDFKTERAQAAGSLLREATRCILLSGTPALSRPAELFTQLQALSPQVFRTAKARELQPKLGGPAAFAIPRAAPYLRMRAPTSLHAASGWWRSWRR